MFRYINDNFNTINDIFTFYNISSKNIYKLCTINAIKVNGDIIKNKEYVLNKGDIVEIDDTCVKESTYIPYNKKIDILYEDEDILIVYKDAPLLVHPDGNTNCTLVNMVANYFKGQDVVFEHLHRLDMDTKGMVIFSKNIFAHSYLAKKWEEKEVEKYYIAKCAGILKKDGYIDMPIANDRHSNKMRVSKGGKSAKTEYKVIEHFCDTTKLEVKIEGGRKHQIRVHLASINHPIIGDKIYGKDGNEMFLQFYKIKFVHPRTHKDFVFSMKELF